MRERNWTKMGVVLFAAGLFLSVFHAAQSEAAENRKISSITITGPGSGLLINKGEKARLRVTVKPKKGVSKKLKWKSSKKSIVSVNQKGVIRGRKYGRAVITARAKDGSGKSARIKVRVGRKVSRLSFSAASRELDVGASLRVKAKVAPANATKKKVKYQSSNTKAATVSSTGVVYGKGKGEATITASSTDGSGKKISCKVSVKIPSQSVKLDVTDSEQRLEAGKTMTINASVLPSNASNRNVRYKSTNPAAAKVSQLGVVTGVASGKTTIQVEAADGRSSASVEVEVYKVELQNEKQIAHRGYSSQAPENTTAAFQLAVQSGFYGVECDVRKTYDGEFVISHDADLNRMCGYNLSISSMSLQQLKQYPITGGKNISQYPDLTIPTLDEYLEIMAESGSVHPFIELKEDFSASELSEIVSRVSAEGLLDRTYFISVHQSNLLELKQIEGVNSENLQYVYGAESANKLLPVDDTVISWCIANAIDLDARYTLITASEVSRLHDGGRKVNVWTVNDVQKACDLVRDANVDMLTTEYLLQS